MPGATRLNDLSTGHDRCPPVPLITGSENVFINRFSAGRQTDMYRIHGCDVHAPHNDVIAVGGSTVFINGIPAGRIGDAVCLAGNVDEGSSNVFIGG